MDLLLGPALAPGVSMWPCLWPCMSCPLATLPAGSVVTSLPPTQKQDIPVLPEHRADSTVVLATHYVDSRTAGLAKYLRRCYRDPFSRTKNTQVFTLFPGAIDSLRDAAVVRPPRAPTAHKGPR